MGKAEPENEMSEPRLWRHGSHELLWPRVTTSNITVKLKLMTDKGRRRAKAMQLEMFSLF